MNRRPSSGCSRCFNPRARAGRDTTQVGDCMRERVSIHAPARGATNYRHVYVWNTQFQSTRPRGARQSRSVITGESDLFQSTRPRGARRKLMLRIMLENKVSIHAPARGATSADDSDRPASRSFNPRARAGRDVARCSAHSPLPCFNPRARAGRDNSAA